MFIVTSYSYMPKTNSTTTTKIMPKDMYERNKTDFKITDTREVHLIRTGIFKDKLEKRFTRIQLSKA